MITRDQALDLIREHVKNENIVKHMIACEALMRSLARKLKFDEEEWAIAGLLHDGDYCKEVPMEKQGVQITQWAKEMDYEIPDNVAYAMAAHNWHNTSVEPKTKMDWALFCGDSLTGLIVASALVLPSKKLADVTAENVLNRFKEKSFARGTRREDIKMCEEKLGIPLKKFIEIGLKAMQKVANELSLD